VLLSIVDKIYSTMKFFAVALIVLQSTPAVAVANAGTTDGDRTMTKVVKLLQDMLKKSKEDGDKDRSLYAEFACYCKDNELDTRESIEEWKKEIQMLENSIDKLQAENGELSTDCAKLKEDIADNEAARTTAEEVRDKENADFMAEEKDMVTGLDAMDQAIDTLSAIGADQTASSGADHAQFMGKGGDFIKLKASVKKALASASVLMNAKEKRTVNSFLQAPFTGTYTSQSGEIVGILKNMRDTFKENLASIRAAEKAAVEAHLKFMKIKEEEHATMTALYEEKQGKLGENDDALANDRESLQEAKDSLAYDEEFLAKLIPMCEKKAKEFEQRNMLRANEQAAISKAIAILNSDAAFEAFGKVKATKEGAMKGAFFLQIQKHDHHGSTRKNVLKLLQGMAQKQKSLKIAHIMVMLEADNPFETVIKEIKKMIVIIDEEQKTDDEQLAWCGSEREEYHGNKEKTEASIEDLEAEIEKIDDSINNPETGFIATIKENESMLKGNHDNQVEETSQRAEANKAYQISIKHTVEAEELLEKAIKVLKAYYSQFNELLQRQDPSENAPTTWDDVESGVQKDAGADVIETLEFIASETKKEENEAHSDEEEAQHDFEDSMKTLKEDQAKLEETIADLRVQLADAEKALGENKANLEKEQAELKGLIAYLEKIKPGCDYIEKNHEERTSARKAEKEALEKATETIKGTPAYKAAVAAQEQEDLGDCKDICNEAGRKHAKCEACLADVSVPGYCAGHAGTEGC
jgi:DNA repair exonuclease SbcCD ATPase subunit